MADVEDVKPIITGIELEDFNDPADPTPGKVFRAPEDGDTSTIGEEMFHPDTRKKKSTAKTALKFAIVIAVVIAIIVAIVCLVIFLGPETTTGTTTTTPTTPRRTTPPSPTMSPTVFPGVVVGDVDVALSATLNGVQFIPAYNNPSSPEFMEFAGKAETEMMNGLQSNDQLGGYVTNVNVTALRDGSVIVDTTISVSGDIAMVLVSGSNATSATDIQLMVANQVSNSANEAVMSSLSNNPTLGSSDVTVEVQDVTVPVNVDGVNLPDSVTPGDPCDDGFFRCNDGTCIAEFNRCDYLDNCETGEDELNCGACTSNQYMCQNTKCIPNYWLCDYHFECPDMDDEIDCGEGEIANIVLVEGQSRLVSTPTFPNPYPPHINSYWSITTQNPDHLIQLNFIDFDLSLGSYLNFENGSETGGPIMDMAVFFHRFHPRPFTLPTNAALMFFYAGPYGGGRGFQVELNAVDSALYAPGTCAPGEYQCPIDGECILSAWQCDGIVDCADGMDEDEGFCASQPPPGECTGANHEYQCDDGSCIHASFRCDYFIDCPGSDDELDCPCDGERSFDCGPGDRCIPDYFVCDWFFDCLRPGVDESSCHSPDFTYARYLNPGESMNFSSPNYPSDYGNDVAYLFTFQTNVGYQIQIDVYDFYAELGAFVTIGDGLDPSNHNSALVAYHHFSSPISVTSSSRSVWISLHGGTYGFGVFYASATSIMLTCEDDEYACPERCIPIDFRCDAFHDCAGGEDEFQCGHEERIDAYTLGLSDVQQFTSPNYPTPYAGNSSLYYWSFDGSNVEGDYVVKFTFHPYNISDSSFVAFGSGLDFTNQTSYYAVYEGQRIDLDLYNHYSIENQVWVEFYTGVNTALYPGFSATAELVLRSDIPVIQCLRDEYACSNGIDCIPGYWECDGRHDCPEGEDESDCDECTAYQFECPEKCISSFYTCDFFPDCENYEDELNCGHPPVVHQDITVDGSVQFTSPLYPNNYPGNGTFFPYTFATSDPSRHIQFDFSVFQLGNLSALYFGTGRDYFNASTTFDVYHARVPPTRVYAPSDVVWVDFYTGFEGNRGFEATVSTYPAGLIPPRVTCNTNQWACLDGLTCIPLAYRCDGYHDCPDNGEDEHGCPSVCREYEFECKNGECLPIHSQCNGVEQCSEGEDEIGCGSPGECTDQQFRCSDGTCVLADKRCNYFYDCPDGSDESQAVCGVCNDIYEYTCSFGNCIPAYWQCDYFYDCALGDDEMSCHILNEPTYITLTMHQQVNISSQNYPYSADHNIYQLWHITAPEGTLIHFDFVDFDLGIQSFLVFSDGHMVGNHSLEWAVYFYRFNPRILLSHNNTISIQYHSGAYVGTKGFFLSMRAVHEGHVHPPCDSTAYQCAEDQECIPAYWQCDGFPDCIASDDEANCTYSEKGECGVYGNEYKCDGYEICFHADFRCDYTPDCPNNDDEFNCTCKESDFQCPRTGQCIPAHSVCDYYYDCINGTEDETIGCGTPSSIMSQTLQQEQLFSINSTYYPDNYPPRDYVVYLITAPDGYVVRVIFNDFDIDWRGFLVFGRGTDYQNHSQTFAVYNHHDTPTDLYTPTNRFFIVFHGGPYGQSRGFNISMIPIQQSAVPTVAPIGTCNPGDFACFDGTCWPGFWECDGEPDCIGGEDEARCYASGGTCQSHQFTCNDGTCIHGSWRCDDFVDCSDGEDEQDCPCSQFEFTCDSTGECIPSVWQCDYFPDCPEGEDEASCTCVEDEYTCSDGACIPHYYTCDGYNDCFTTSDEMDCGTPNNTENIMLMAGEERRVQSPGYPMPHDTLCYYLWIITVPEGLYVHVIFHEFSVSIHTYLSLGTGSDADNSTSRYAIYYHRTAPHEAVIPSNVAWVEYHCGHFANGRGFDMTVTTTNISTHMFPDCVDGEVQCYDGHCIPSHFLCDTERDCSMGEDEGHNGLRNCTAYDHRACGNHVTEFECNDGSGCIHADYVCDSIYDCAFGADELNCPRNCTEHEFQCPGRQCIPLTLRCNFFPDCIAGIDDELDCGTPQNTEYIYLDGNSTILISPNYPGNYPKNTYTVAYVSTTPGKVIQVTFNSLQLSLLSFLAFGNGTNTHDFTQILEVYTHKTEFPPSIFSTGHELFIEFFTGIYAESQGYNITLDAVNATEVTFPPCAEHQFQCVSDGECITLDWVCDNFQDCGDNSDEENCQVTVGPTCSSDEFQCITGNCIPGHWQCDNYIDCFFGEDEEGCGFTCFPDEYACEASQQCIPASWQCDYFPDCAIGEDETSCGECGEGFFNCSDGACVPEYYVCDAYEDCFTELDEQSCGNPTNTEYITLGLGEEQNIQSPGYPDVNQHDSLCYVEWIVTVPEGFAVHLIFHDFSVPLHAWLQMGTGVDADDDSSRYAIYFHRTNPREVVVPDSNVWISYHCGLLGLGRGFDITIRPTNIRTHNYTACVAGEFQCNDGHCIPSHYLCDTEKDCSMAEDEEHTMGRVNCSSFDHNECGTHETEFQCPIGNCIHADRRCDQIYDCPTGTDEIQCPACDPDTMFQCTNEQCIHSYKRCDFILDCLSDNSDELNCGTPENTIYIYLSQNSTNITSANYPEDYPSNEYTLWKIHTDPGRMIRVIFYDVEFSLNTFLAFGRGTDTQDFTNLFEAYTHRSAFPAELYTLTHELFIEFHAGIYARTRGFFLGLEDSDSSGVTFAPCAEDEFQCPSDGVCIPATWECDGFNDCGYHGDEIDCQAQGGTCKPHQFTCDDGTCIHADYQCDFFTDCSDDSDEAGCPFRCPFADSQFACNNSMQCVFQFQVCNYIADCDLGEDEENCGTCGDGFLTCSNGGCVPNYWKCDGDNDCFDGGDEADCGSVGTIENLVLGQTDAEVIAYPGNSMLHEANCYVGWQITVPTGHYVLVRFHFFDIALSSYLTMGTGLDHSDQDTLVANYHHRHRPRERVIPSNQAWIEFHCGPVGRGRGFNITVSPVDPNTHIYPACDSDQSRCMDESCIETFDLCNGQKDCLGGEDEEQNCTEFNHFECGTHENEYLCPDGFYCIHGDWRCDGVIDCFLGGDELGCNCSIGEFECPDRQCIPGSYYCDGFFDCLRGTSDEMDCGNPNNTMSYSITGPMNITSPNYPNYYPVHDYALTLITVDENSVVQARILDFDLSHTSFVTFRNGHDTEAAGSLIVRLGYSSDVIEGETEFYSMNTNVMAIEWHSGFYGQARGFLIEVSASTAPTCSSDEFTCEDATCIPYSFVCDFYPDCPGFDYSDEASCQAPEGGTCEPMLYTCDNGGCITPSYLCDGWLDCEGGEDESDCPAK